MSRGGDLVDVMSFVGMARDGQFIDQEDEIELGVGTKGPRLRGLQPDSLIPETSFVLVHVGG